MAYLKENLVSNIQTNEESIKPTDEPHINVQEYMSNFCLTEEKNLLYAIKNKDVRTMCYAALELSRVVEMYLRTIGGFSNADVIYKKLIEYGDLLKMASVNKLDYPEVNYRFFAEALKEASARLVQAAYLVKENRTYYQR